MKKIMIIGFAASVAVGCNTTEVETPSEDVAITDNESSGNSETSIIDSEQTVEDDKKLNNGITIKWFEHGEGEKLTSGDLVQIDYKVQLEDGKVVDGNHLLTDPKTGKSMESMPFMIGFGMQTEGWDIALKELRVGDFAEIFIPSELARGEKGIKDLIPPNADNVLRIRILEKTKPTREVDGNKVWVFEENSANTIKFNESNEIEFHTIVSTESSPMYVNTFRDNAPFRLRLEDGGTVPGLKKALINAKKSDRMFVLVPSEEAYGSSGYQDVVKPNEDILYNILVMNVSDK